MVHPEPEFIVLPFVSFDAKNLWWVMSGLLSAECGLLDGRDQRGVTRLLAPCNIGSANGVQAEESSSFFTIPLKNGSVVVFEL